MPAGATIDTVEPPESWAFDEQVTECFDDMLKRSIPQYDVMRDAVTSLTGLYAVEGTDIVDLGCSRGDATKWALRRVGDKCRYVAVESSEPMYQAAQTELRPFIDKGIAEVIRLDLRKGYPQAFASVTMCVLTLQFIPIEYRQTIVRSIYEHTLPGGALILVEKVLGNSSNIDASMVDLYYKLKGQNGYSRSAIEKKRESLEGVLVPITASWNEQLVRDAGFSSCDCFWRWMNFAGWLAVK